MSTNTDLKKDRRPSTRRSVSPAATTLGLRMPRNAVLARILRLVAIIGALVIFVLPLWTIVATAFSRNDPKAGQLSLLPSHPTLKNLSSAWDLGVGHGLITSALVVGIGLVLQISVSALAAYSLARKKFRGLTIVLVLILTTMMMPEEIIALPLYSVLSSLPDPLGQQPSMLNTLSGLILPIVGWALPIYVLTGFMKTIPIELEEAARIDGAGDLRIFFRLILPLSRPALGTCAVFGFLMIWEQFLLPLLVSQDPNKFTLTLVTTVLEQSDNVSDHIRLAAALFLLVPSVLVFLLLQRFFERGLISGSVKG